MVVATELSGHQGSTPIKTGGIIMSLTSELLKLKHRILREQSESKRKELIREFNQQYFKTFGIEV